MVIAYYIVAGLAALFFLAVGAMKLLRPKPALKDAGLAWVDDFSPAAVKLIGLVELLGAFGLILPRLTGIAPVLSPIAAIGLVIVMIGAIVVHVRRKEAPGMQIGVAVLAAAAAVLGFAVL